MAGQLYYCGCGANEQYRYQEGCGLGTDARLWLIGGQLVLIYAFLVFLKFYGLVIQQKRRLAASLTGLLACVLALQSVGELNIKDVVLLLPLIVVGYAYASYNLSRHNSA